jgi:RluA family pseudouridine synthase
MFSAMRRSPALAHRLDRDTSGCLVLGRHRKALARLGRLFAAGKIEKVYWAIVVGAPAHPAGRIEKPLAKRTSSTGWRVIVAGDGVAAVTDYRVLAAADGHAWVECRPRTGRTHQIRVHLDAIGHPVAGDPVYGTGTSRRGPAGLGRLFLHAWRLELTSPSDGHLIRATAPLPLELDAVLGGLREVVR